MRAVATAVPLDTGYAMRLRFILAAVLFSLPGLVLAAPADYAPLPLSGPDAGSVAWKIVKGGELSDTPCPWVGAPGSPGRGLRIDVAIPGEAGVGAALDNGCGRWHPFTSLNLSVYVPPEAPAGLRLIVYLRDADLNYFQHVHVATLPSGTWTDVELDLTDRSRDWEPVGHYMPWDGYCRQDVQEVGVKFYSDVPYSGPLYVDRVRVERHAESLAAENAIYDLRPNTVEVGRYERFELSFHLARTYDNPFDPDQVDVHAVITRPDGTTVTVPGFFYQGFLRRRERGEQVLVPMGRSQWKGRFAPRQLGTYTYRIEVADGELLQSDPGEFRCIRSDSRGFVRRSKIDPDYLEFDDGSFYYPIGHNVVATFDVRARVLGVNIPAAEGTYAFDRFLERMGNAGENFVRVWMSPWSFGIEWTKAYDVHFKGLGRYNLQRAWCLDHVLDTAREHGVYIMLLLTSHGEIGEHESDFEGGDPQHLQGSPYWSRYGGPLDQAIDIYSSGEALKFYKRKVRYVAARWGYATSIMAWEVFNEPDLAFYHNPQKLAYGQQVAAFVEKIFTELNLLDPSDHLTTSNIWQPTEAYARPSLELKDMDLFAIHVFDPNLSTELARVRRFLKTQYNQLVLVTEADTTPHAEDPDLTARVMHQTLWTSCTLPMAGTACPWWWVLIDRKDLYGEFAAVAAFARGEDRRGKGYESAAALATDKERRRRLRAQCLRTSGPDIPYRALCWVWAPEFFTRQAIGEDEAPAPGTLLIPDTPNGRYTVEVWDTHAGAPIATDAVECTDGTLTYQLPPFVGDVACKVWPAE
jgi:hypothetical protein